MHAGAGSFDIDPSRSCYLAVLFIRFINKPPPARSRAGPAIKKGHGDVRNAWQFVKEILWEISWLRNFVTSRKEILNPEGEDANSVS